MDLKVRFNKDSDDIELVVDDKVIDTVGTEVVESWIVYYNDKHGYAKRVVEVETDKPQEVVETSETKEEAPDESESEESASKED